MIDQTEALRALDKLVTKGGVSAPTFYHAAKVALHESPSPALTAYNGSLDAAKNLHVSVVPAFQFAIYPDGEVWVFLPTRNGPPRFEGRAKIPNALARTWLLAIIRAKLAELEGA